MDAEAFNDIGNFFEFPISLKTPRDAHDVQWKAACSSRTSAPQSGASPARIEGYRVFEADLSALFYLSAVRKPKSNKEVHHSWQKLN